MTTEPRFRVFDWNKAATLIRERGPSYADAGLRHNDSAWWGESGCTIYRDGTPVVSPVAMLSCDFLLPEIALDGERQECWLWADEAPGWNGMTRWPASALAILGGGENSQTGLTANTTTGDLK